MLERPLEHPRQDLHVPMPVRRKPPASYDTVLVDHAQAPEAHVRRIVVLGERERVARVEPAVVEMAALGRGADADHWRTATPWCQPGSGRERIAVTRNPAS